MMTSNLHARLFERLSDLIPGLHHAAEGSAFYAPPRIHGDLASLCCVVARQDNVVQLELAHDELVGTDEVPAPCLTLRVDLAGRLASVVSMQDASRPGVGYTDVGTSPSQRLATNLYVANWLAMMIHLGGAFQPVSLPVTAS